MTILPVLSSPESLRNFFDATYICKPVQSSTARLGVVSKQRIDFRQSSAKEVKKKIVDIYTFNALAYAYNLTSWKCFALVATNSLLPGNIGSVGDELAQEDLFVGVEGVDDQAWIPSSSTEKISDIRLSAEAVNQQLHVLSESIVMLTSCLARFHK